MSTAHNEYNYQRAMELIENMNNIMINEVNETTRNINKNKFNMNVFKNRLGNSNKMNMMWIIIQNMTGKNPIETLIDKYGVEETIKEFPKEYSKWKLEKLKKAGEKLECVICMEECCDKAKFLPCNHGFHRNCINAWNDHNSSCPICRAKI